MGDMFMHGNVTDERYLNTHRENVFSSLLNLEGDFPFFSKQNNALYYKGLIVVEFQISGWLDWSARDQRVALRSS